MERNLNSVLLQNSHYLTLLELHFISMIWHGCLSNIKSHRIEPNWDGFDWDRWSEWSVLEAKEKLGREEGKKERQTKSEAPHILQTLTGRWTGDRWWEDIVWWSELARGRRKEMKKRHDRAECKTDRQRAQGLNAADDHFWTDATGGSWYFFKHSVMHTFTEM